MSSNTENFSALLERILSELRGIGKTIVLANGVVLEKELSKYATTPERRKAWALMDGNRDVPELITASGLKKRSVYDFLEYLERAGLIERVYGKPPRRLVDFIPAAWADMAKSVQAAKGKNHESEAGASDAPSSGDEQNG